MGFVVKDTKTNVLTDELSERDSFAGRWKIHVLVGFLVIVLLSGGLSRTARSEETPTKGLTGHWTFDRNAADSSGNGLHGTRKGKVALAPSAKVGSSSLLLRRKRKGHVVLPTHKLINKRETLKTYTISVWVNVANPSISSRKQVIYEQGGYDRGLIIYVYDGKLYVGGWNDDEEQSGWSGTYLSTPDIRARTWHHVALTLKGGPRVQNEVLAGYLDGQQFDVGSGSQLWKHLGDPGVGAIAGSTVFQDGESRQDGGHQLVGLIDDLRLYDRALSSSELQVLANQTTSQTADAGEAPSSSRKKRDRPEKNPEKQKPTAREEKNEPGRPPLGTILNEPGAVKGNRSWKKAWELKSPHFHIRTNISPKAMKEIGYVMEALYKNFNQLLNASLRSRVDVLVPKNRRGFDRIQKMPNQVKGYFSTRDGGRIVTYYQPGEIHNTTATLLHEGTHLIVLSTLGFRPVDIWINEGLAVYFEASRFERTNMIIGMKPKRRMKVAKRMVKSGRYVPIKKLVRMKKRQFTGRHYAQAWSLVHYLVHAHDNKYVNQLDKYLLSFKNHPNVGAIRRFRKFFPAFDKLEKDWKRYVREMNLKGEDVVKIGTKNQ